MGDSRPILSKIQEARRRFDRYTAR